ncbi:hypothetical protein F444_10320 [Phytophthora nicotianae P1976]|uniref:Uncharacterized protein n=1 Tax=Phytophthora nicotianae P1976 TaxID=1317066 RepID=A0A081A4H0_PHYNI|nr:hypothetical protein F444_10320 [Phytophthora nicotianae P1976]
MQPWCRVLHQKIKYKAEKREWDVWCEQKHRLEVKLPMRCQFTEDSDGEEIDFGHDFDLSWSGEECFQDKFIKTREALAFLVFGCCGSCGSKDLEISTCGTLWREIGQGDLEQITTWPEMATKVGKLITKSLCFSEIEMRVHRDPTYVGDERTSRLLFGELFCEAV